MKFSDEMINAYADGELQGGEKAEFEEALKNDVKLQQAVDCVFVLKAQLHDAYRGVDAFSPAQNDGFGYRVAGFALMFLLVFSSGWLGGDLMHRTDKVNQDNAYFAGGINAAQEVKGKFVLHIGTHDQVKFKQAIDEIENLLVSYRSETQPIELEVIANAGGLNLFREDGSPYVQKVKQISQQYPNVKFIACANAIERLRERGIEPKLIDAVRQGTTALDQVVKRMNEGWTYIKI